MGREEHCKQISLACVGSAYSVPATLDLPPLTECVLCQSTLLRLQVTLQGNCLKQALGCHALPRSKPLRFRYLGSPQRHGLGWACVLCPSQVRAALVTRCWRARSLRLIASPVPATRFYGCTAGAPSQADVDCPESQAVLVSHEACLQFGR